MKAKKTYSCTECGSKIKKWDPYQLVQGTWDGEEYIDHICQFCVAVRSLLGNIPPTYGYIHEDIMDSTIPAPAKAKLISFLNTQYKDLKIEDLISWRGVPDEH